MNIHDITYNLNYLSRLARNNRLLRITEMGMFPLSPQQTESLQAAPLALQQLNEQVNDVQIRHSLSDT